MRTQERSFVRVRSAGLRWLRMDDGQCRSSTSCDRLRRSRRYRCGGEGHRSHGCFRHLDTLRPLNTVIPAKAGVHVDFRWLARRARSRWIPAFAGMTSGACRSLHGCGTSHRREATLPDGNARCSSTLSRLPTADSLVPTPARQCDRIAVNSASARSTLVSASIADSAVIMMPAWSARRSREVSRPSRLA
jgi:hypothetical protein